MKKLDLVILLLISTFLITCSKDSPTKSNGNVDDYNPNGHWDQPYFVNEIFYNKYNPSISGDGKILYVSQSSEIFYSTLSNNVWSQLVKLPLEGRSPCISYDGKTLYFEKSGKIYRSTKSGNNWSTPTYLFEGRSPTINKDANTMFYFLFDETVNNYIIQYAKLENNNWVLKSGIPQINTLGLVRHPSISGDGTLLFFDRGEEGDYKIYYSRKIDGNWQDPIMLSSLINFTTENYTPCISWDKKNLYYSTFSYGTNNPSPGIYVSHWINE